MEGFDYTVPNNGMGNYNQPENENNESAPGFFKQFPYAFNPQKYGELVRTKIGSVIGFVVLLALVCTLISALNFVIFHGNTDAIKEQLDKFPDFCIKNGELSMAEDFVYAYEDGDEGMFISISSDVESCNLSDAQELYEEDGYSVIVLASRTNLVMASDGEYNTLVYKDFGNLVIDKQWIMQVLIPFFMIFVLIGYIVFFVGRTFWYFACAAFYMLVGMICAAIFHKKFEAGVLFKTAVYAKVLMFVVASVLAVLPVTIEIPGFIRTMITLAMMIFAFQVIPQKPNVQNQ